MRKIGAAVIVLVVAMTSTLERDARADDAECSASYQSAQRLRIAGKLRASRDALLACTQLSCAEFIKTDCTRWLGEVEAALPTVVFAAVDDDGSDLLGAETFVDGERIADATDGLPHALDPGAHAIVLRARGRSVEQHVVLRAGDKGRRLELRLVREAVIAARSRPVPLATYVFGGVALALFAVGGSFWGVGTSDASAYNAQCIAVGCSSDARASVLRELVVGDVAFATGLVSAVVATIFFVARPSVSIRVRPVSGGASFVLSAPF